MSEIETPEVLAVFDSYPSEMRQKLLFLRGLIFEVAQEIEDIKAWHE